MSLLAKLIPDARGVVDIYKQTTYSSLHGLVPRERDGRLAFSTVIDQPGAPYDMATYERVAMLMTGGFAD